MRRRYPWNSKHRRLLPGQLRNVRRQGLHLEGRRGDLPWQRRLLRWRRPSSKPLLFRHGRRPLRRSELFPHRFVRPHGSPFQCCRCFPLGFVSFSRVMQASNIRFLPLFHSRLQARFLHLRAVVDFPAKLPVIAPERCLFPQLVLLSIASRPPCRSRAPRKYESYPLITAALSASPRG